MRILNLEQTNQKLEELTSVLEVDKKRKVRIAIIDHELGVLRHQHMDSHKLLKKERADVEELEKRNLKSIFTELLGTKEQQLNQEKQEFLQAVLIHNSLVDEIHALEEEKKLLSKFDLVNKREVEKEIKNLLILKKGKLVGDPRFKKTILDFDANIATRNTQIREVNEALTEAILLENKFKKIISDLKHVKKWGPYKMHGKGRYSSYNKKTYIDNANRETIIANVQIKKLDKELKDIYPSLDLHLTLDSYENFLDIFYDNLITDWMIVKKLDTAIHSSESVFNKLLRIKMVLENELKKAKKELDILNKEKKEFIAKS